MAEMTASEAIELLKRQWEHLFSLNQDQIDGLMKLIQQQAETIEAQAIEIELACGILGKTSECPYPRPEDSIGNCAFPREQYQNSMLACAACWQKWLERQVKEGQ